MGRCSLARTAALAVLSIGVCAHAGPPGDARVAGEDGLVRLLATTPRPEDATALRPLRGGERALEAAFEATLEDDALGIEELARLWRPFGLGVGRIDLEHDHYWWLHESLDDPNGRGTFLLRRPPGPLQTPVLMLHAPHQFSDRRTGRVAARLAWRMRPRVVAVNSVPRAWQGSTVGAQNHDVYAAALARALVRVEPTSWVVQVHGFSGAKRITADGAAASVIVSNGTHHPDPSVRRLASDLGASFLGVRLFPDDVSELGGTRSAVGRALRAAGSNRFIHIEMSAPARRTLAEDGIPEAFIETLRGLR